MKYNLGDIVEVEKKTINPQKTPSDYYCVYSLPGFDNGKTPERLTGSKILSNKIIINRDNYILFNKLNLKFKRVWRFKNDGGNNVCSTEFLPLYTINNDKVDLDYLYYSLVNDGFYARLVGQNSGTSNSHQRIHKEDLLSMEIDLPDLEVQQKTVRILSALDQKIESNCKQNDLLFSIAEGKFNQIYNSGTRRRLDSIIFNIESGSRPRGGAEKIGIPSIGAEKIEKFGIYDYSSEKYIGENYYSNMKRGVLKDKDVLLYKDGAYTGKSSMCLSGFPHAKAAVNEHVFILNTKDNYAQFYLYFCINKKENQEMLHRMASSKAAQPGLNQSEVKSLEVNIVSDADIEKFESEISPFMEKIANNTLQNKTLSGLRDASLPKLMSDEINLDEVTIDE